MTRKHEILFEEETRVLEHYQELIEEAPANDALKMMTEKYRELLDQTKFLTRISDRLENRLQSVNQTLAQKNIELTSALDELTKARISKQAYLIIYFIAGLLFVFEEFFIDPIASFVGKGLGMVLVIKLCIALLLKPTESLLENRLLAKVKRKTQQ